MNLYKIVNPSDPYTIEASSLDVASVASFLLGQGHYGFSSLDDSDSVPMFSFVAKPDEWCQDRFKESLMEMSNRVIDTKLAEVADCLDSVLYGDRADRLEFLESTRGMNREIFELERAMRQEKKRSSMNDIGERAYRMAANLRKSIDDGIRTLQ